MMKDFGNGSIFNLVSQLSYAYCCGAVLKSAWNSFVDIGYRLDCESFFYFGGEREC